jgi:hypothetical protein
MHFSGIMNGIYLLQLFLAKKMGVPAMPLPYGQSQQREEFEGLAMRRRVMSCLKDSQRGDKGEE